LIGHSCTTGLQDSGDFSARAWKTSVKEKHSAGLHFFALESVVLVPRKGLRLSNSGQQHFVCGNDVSNTALGCRLGGNGSRARRLFDCSGHNEMLNLGCNELSDSRPRIFVPLKSQMVVDGRLTVMVVHASTGESPVKPIAVCANEQQKSGFLLVSVLPQHHLMRIASNDAHFRSVCLGTCLPLTLILTTETGSAPSV